MKRIHHITTDDTALCLFDALPLDVLAPIVDEAARDWPGWPYSGSPLAHWTALSLVSRAHRRAFLTLVAQAGWVARLLPGVEDHGRSNEWNLLPMRLASFHDAYVEAMDLGDALDHLAGDTAWLLHPDQLPRTARDILNDDAALVAWRNPVSPSQRAALLVETLNFFVLVQRHPLCSLSRGDQTDSVPVDQLYAYKAPGECERDCAQCWGGDNHINLRGLTPLCDEGRMAMCAPHSEILVMYYGHFEPRLQGRALLDALAHNLSMTRRGALRLRRAVAQ